MTENDIHNAITKAPNDLKLRLAIECNGDVEKIKKLERTVATLVNGYMSTYGKCFKYMGGIK